MLIYDTKQDIAAIDNLEPKWFTDKGFHVPNGEEDDR